MEKFYEVTVGNKKATFKEGTTYKEIADYFQKDYKDEIIAIKVNNDFIDLGKIIERDCDVSFFTIADEYGNNVYSRSARFILILAVKKAFGKKADVLIHHSLNQGIYFTIEGVKLNSKSLDLLKEEYKKIVDSDLLFTHLTVSRLEAMNYFHKKKMYDKEALLKYISNTYITLYRIDDLYDYFYGRMVYSTKQIKYYKLNSINDVFILALPKRSNPTKVTEVKTDVKMNQRYQEAIAFEKSINVTKVSDLNLKISKAEIKDIVLMSEAYFDNQLIKVADDIISKKKKIVLLAGPSSSGKTTSAKKLSIYLKSRGYNTISLSVDDYFTDLKVRVKDANGNPDFESVKAVDIKLFNTHLTKLLDGEEVIVPTFDFIKGKRYFDKSAVKLEKNDIIVIEGLHAINEKLTSSIDKKYKYKIFISPLESLNIDNHNHIHSTDVRKLRRITRDSRTRGFSASKTLQHWDNVHQGELINVFPYECDADAILDSCLLYEIGVLKTYVEPLLYSVESNDSEYPEALRLINLLKNFLPIPVDDIPNDSVLREFIGGSCFK